MRIAQEYTADPAGDRTESRKARRRPKPRGGGEKAERASQASCRPVRHPRSYGQILKNPGMSTVEAAAKKLARQTREAEMQIQEVNQIMSTAVGQMNGMLKQLKGDDVNRHSDS
jgi:hypothetical protein